MRFVPFGDAAALEATLDRVPDGSALVLLEPVQAEGGVVLPPDGYLGAVADACSRHGALLAVDEVQTGLGRLGTWWGADREGVTPDLLVTGKALGGGALAVSAVVATTDVFEGLNRDPFLHTSTFGSPLAARTARATIETMQEEAVVERTAALGSRPLPAVREAVGDMGGLVQEVRGRGLMIGIELVADDVAGELVLELLKRRVIVSHSLNATRVVRLTPSAILGDEHVDWLLEALATRAAILASRRTADPQEV